MRHSASERHSDYNLPLPLLFSSSFLAFVNLLVCLLLRHSWNFLRNKPRQPSAPKPKLVVGMSGVLFACEGFSGGDGDRSTWQAHRSLHLLRHFLRKEENARHGALSSFVTLLHLLLACPKPFILLHISAQQLTAQWSNALHAC